MASRPRSSLASGSGLPTPGGGGGVTARRKSGLPSPGSSPTKGSKRPSDNDDIAVRMSELQAAIRSKDPASYGASGRRSALGASTTNDEDEVEMLQPLTDQSPPEFTSPRPVRRIVSSGSALRPTPQSGLRSLSQRNGNDGGGTPTSTPGPGASFVRPNSSLSSSSYMSAQAARDGRSRSPIPPDMPVTPAKRPGDLLAPTSAILKRTASNVSSASTFLTARSSLDNEPDEGGKSVLQVNCRVKAAGMEGILRYIGEVAGKPGTWAGVELVEEYSGQGKNNGTVQGHQYFACKEKDGIFALLSKVELINPAYTSGSTSSPVPSKRTYSRPSSALSMSGSSAAPTPRRPLPRASGSLVPPSTVARNAAKSSSDASQYANSQITAGSRASSYLNLTAKQLQERKAQTGPSGAGSPSTLRSPRKSGVLGTSTSSAYTTGGPTPKATRTTGRPSAVPTTARKSIGGPATPSAASSIRRPPSSLRSHTPDVPSVPPLPSGMSNASNVSATPAKRYSGISRPTTPSGRPSSRLSNAGSVTRSVSRASSRASMLSGPSRLSHRGEEDAEETLQDTGKTTSQEMQHTKEALGKATREAEQAKLELLELTSDFKDEQKRRKALQHEVDELKRKAADSRLDQASAIDERQAEKEHRAAELVRLQEEADAAHKEVEKVKADNQNLLSELEQGHDILARVQEERDASAKEAKSLTVQLDELQKAGRAMVDLYEDKFRNLEEEFTSTQEALQMREKQVCDLQEELERNQALLAKREQANRDSLNADAILAASLSGGRPPEQQESALAIENDDLRAELEHVKKRMALLEEQSYDARVEFESQLEKEKQKQHEKGDAIEKLKSDLKDLKDKVEKIRVEKEKSEQRAQELELALKESQQALETERIELESLRNEHSQNSSAARSDEVVHLRSALTVAQHENKDKEKEIKKLKADLEALQEELKLMEEIKEEVKADGEGDSDETSQLMAEIREKDERILKLQQELIQSGTRNLPRISTQPTDTDAVPTPVQASFNQLLSPPDHPASPKESPSSSTSSRRKRDSNNSVHSNTSLSSLTSASSNYRRASLKDESSMMKDEIEGLKILLKQAESENASLRSKYEATCEEANRLKDAQKALENTVNNLVLQLEKQQSGQGRQSPLTMPTLPPKTSSQELLEAEVRELKENLVRMEKEYKKDKDNLNSEVLQLELLVEAKIFREGELESQLEDVRRALAEAKRASHALSKNGLPEPIVRESPRRGKSTVKPERASVTSISSSKNGSNDVSVASGRRSASQYSEEDYDDGLCEICKEDHAVENCPIFGGSAASDTDLKANKKKSNTTGDANAPYCDDCEEYGHDLANCPLADEIF